VSGANAGDDRVTGINFQLAAFKYDYVFELQSLMLQAMRNLDFIKSMLFIVDFNQGDFTKFKVQYTNLQEPSLGLSS
jgi:hypothetical protein